MGLRGGPHAKVIVLMTSVFEIIRSCSTWEGYTFDPGTLIRAVNILRNDKPSDVIVGLRSYAQAIVNDLDLVDGNTRLILLLRLLFVPAEPGTAYPSVAMGKPVDVENPPLQDYPLYPLVLLNDVPLLIVTGFLLGGLPADPMSQIEFFEQDCRMRPAPLRPPDNPLPLAETLLASPTWYRKDFDRDRGVLRAQLLRLVRAVYDVPGVDEPNFYSSVISDEVWEGHLKSFGALRAVWDPVTNDYRC